MSDPTLPDAPEGTFPPSLRFLKWLVVALTLTMIGGVITVVALLVTRMPQAVSASLPDLPDQITLPDGAKASAVTIGEGWFAVVTTDDRVLIFDRDGNLRQDLAIGQVEKP